MKRTPLLILAALTLIAALMLAGCEDKRTRISSILERPEKYMNDDVIVAGKVTDTYSVNLFIAEAGAYRLDDGTGKIWILTRTGVPEEGTEVGLKGEVTGGVKIMGESFGAVVKERERKTR
jgi:hypothetical protein